MLSNIVLLAYLQRAKFYLEAYISNLEQAQQSVFKFPNLILALFAYVQYRLHLQVLQTQGLVHVPCNVPVVNARSHPTFYGSYVATFSSGDVFTNYEEQLDFPEDLTKPPRAWVRISEYYAYNGRTLWIRRQDTEGNTLLIDGGQPQGCLPNPTPIPGSPAANPPLDYDTAAPDCINSGTCLTGNESLAYQIAFILACESGAHLFPLDNVTAMRQAMIDIAYVLRNRVQASQFPNNLLDVISQAGTVQTEDGPKVVYQFQCYGEGATADLSAAIAIAASIGEELEAAQGQLREPVLPPPSFSGIEKALWFYGLPWQNLDPDKNFAANSIDHVEVREFFLDREIVSLTSQFVQAAALFDALYLGHGPIGQPDPTLTSGFTTFFFSDNPRFTGVIPD